MTAPPAPAHPVPTPEGKRRYVREMFSDIAPRYDLLNRVLSLNVDRSWRRRAVARLLWQRRPAGCYLDACAGTMDLAVALATQAGFRGRVVAGDFAIPMLRAGRSKPATRALRPVAADTLQLPARDGAFDGVTIGFGLRNLADVDAGIAELRRVLSPGARLVILDFTMPRLRPLRWLYRLYFRRILPVVGRLVSGHATAYSYLPESVQAFPAPADLERKLAAAGFTDCGHVLLTGGIAAVIWGAR